MPVFDGHSGERVRWPQVYAAMDNADIVILGEQHTDAPDNALVQLIALEVDRTELILRLLKRLPVEVLVRLARVEEDREHVVLAAGADLDPLVQLDAQAGDDGVDRSTKAASSRGPPPRVRGRSRTT